MSVSLVAHYQSIHAYAPAPGEATSGRDSLGFYQMGVQAERRRGLSVESCDYECRAEKCGLKKEQMPQ
jgi:hypothetical protein